MEAVAPTHAKIPIRLTVREIWQSLSQEERIEAAEACWQSGGVDDALLKLLSERLRFRPTSMVRQPLAWRAQKLAQQMSQEGFTRFLPNLLRGLHLVARQQMLSRFLDAARISHAEGVIADEVTEPPTVESLTAGLRVVAPEYPISHILTYFRTLLALDSQETPLWRYLPEVAEQIEMAVVETPAGSPTPTSEPEPAGDETEPEPETSHGFSQLDDLLIKTIVASALEIDGAPERARIDDMIDELLHLNADRKRSFFHKGFFEAVFGVEVNLRHIGENIESRLWYVTGVVMGWLRQGKASLAGELLRRESMLMDEICRDTNQYRINMLLPAIYPVLGTIRLWQQCAAYLRQGLPRLEPPKADRLSRQVLEDGSNLLRDNEPGDALLLLETLPEPPIEILRQADPQGAFGRTLVRKKAQCFQVLGRAQLAESRLRMVAELGVLDESIDALADLGLLAAGFSLLYGVVPGKTPMEQHSLADALGRGQPLFEQSIANDLHSDGTRSRNAHFALGIMYIMRPEPEPHPAAQHLHTALAGMLRDPQSYERGNLVAWARYLLGLSTLENCDSSTLRSAAGLIRGSLQSDVVFPLTLWARCLAAASLFDDKSLALEIAEELLKRRGPADTFDLVLGSGVLSQSGELRSRYLDWTTKTSRPVSKLADDWELVLHESLADGQTELAMRALDNLEGLSQRWDDYADRFAKLLEDSTNYSPAWDPDDADEARVRLFESRGQLEEAAQLLQKQFWKLRADPSEDARADVQGILAHLQELCRPPAELAMLAQHLPTYEDEVASQLVEDDPINRTLREGGRINILFVGGDERQAKHDRTVTKEIAAKCPVVKVEFIHPGWGTNWAPVADKIEDNLSEYDGLVLSHLVRTNMGRRLRKMCTSDTPWFACRGAGPGVIEASIVNAARRVVHLRKTPKI